MRQSILSSLLALPLALANPFPKDCDENGFPFYGLKTNGVAVGWLPSNGNATEGVTSPRYTMKEINSRLGVISSAYGMYSHINSQNYDPYELMEEFDDVVRSGAVFIASVMPVLLEGFTAINEHVAAQIAKAMKAFTDEGVVVYLRYGHEMNWYTDPAAEPRYYGTPAEFVESFKLVADAVRDNPLVSMFWSPNNIGNGSADTLDVWYPGDQYVDITGIDVYPNFENQTFAYGYKNFYDRFAAGKNKPFVIGETGASGDMREWWLNQLVSQDRAEWPNYKSFSWFEYNKGVDFRLVMGQNQTILSETKKELGIRRW